MKSICVWSVLLAVLLLLEQPLLAQEKRADNMLLKSSLALELNAVYLAAFQGLGVNAYYNLPSKWSFGVGAVYGGLNDIPRFAAGNFFTNQENTNLRWLYAFNVQAKYFFGEKSEGIYAQVNLGYEGWRVRPNDITNVENIHTNWFIVPVVGYNWFPFVGSGFYLDGNLSPIFLFAGPTDEQLVGGVRYQFRNNAFTLPNVNINLGWRF